MKFEAKKLDLALELITLEGKEVELDCKEIVTGEKAAEIMDSIATMDKEFNLAKDIDKRSSAMIALLGKQLSSIYDNDPSWWGQNLDPGSIVEIKNHVVSSLMKVRKKEQN